jgi:hypothetical protein
MASPGEEVEPPLLDGLHGAWAAVVKGARGHKEGEEETTFALIAGRWTGTDITLAMRDLAPLAEWARIHAQEDTQ